jgi:DNA-binding GntR family transcriptional regulator
VKTQGEFYTLALPGPAFRALLARMTHVTLLDLYARLQRTEHRLMAAIDDLNAEVVRVGASVASAIALIQALQAALAAGNSDVAVAGATQHLTASQAALDAAVLAAVPAVSSPPITPPVPPTT